MNTRSAVLVLLVSTAAGYFIGRYSAPERVRVETKTEVKTIVVQDEARKLNQVQRIIETTRPDGRPIKTTVIKTVEASERKTSEIREGRTEDKRVIENRRGIAVGLIAGLPLAEIARGPVYGAAVAIPVKIPFLPEAFFGPVFLASPNLFFGVQGGIRF